MSDKVLAVLLLTLAFLSTAVGEIRIENHGPNSIVRYQVVLLRGSFDGGEIEVRNLAAKKGEKPIRHVTAGEHFKALVTLNPGENRIALQSGDTKLELPITYEPQTSPHYLRLVWLSDKDGGTDFATPTDDHPQDYAARLRTAALLMQTFTAERMHDLGYGRKTFRLERDGEGEVVVHNWKGDLSAAEYYALGDNNTYWGAINQFIAREHGDPFAKNCVLASFTRKDEETGKMKGHTALGGGQLGLFGSASVFSWPRSVQGALKVFSDDTPVDPTRVHDDSAGRGTNWGLASTTIGATLHEMGHTFGLPHCEDGLGIMTRGFDHFHRVFVFQDPPSNRKKESFLFPADKEAYFAHVSASYLQHSPWFRLDTTEEMAEDQPQIEIDKETGAVTVRSPAGVPWVGLWVGPNIRHAVAFKTASGEIPKEATISAEDVAKHLRGDVLSTVTAIGTNGQQARARATGIRRLGK